MNELCASVLQGAVFSGAVYSRLQKLDKVWFTKNPMERKTKVHVTPPRLGRPGLHPGARPGGGACILLGCGSCTAINQTACPIQSSMLVVQWAPHFLLCLWILQEEPQWRFRPSEWWHTRLALSLPTGITFSIDLMNRAGQLEMGFFVLCHWKAGVHFPPSKYLSAYFGDRQYLTFLKRPY